METDSLFYRLLSEKPKLVFELLGEKPPRTTYTFSSYEKNKFYPSFFTKIFTYLRDYEPPNDWRAVILFTKRRHDRGVPIHYQDFVTTERLQRVYLDEMSLEMRDRSLETSLIQLFGLDQQSAVDRATAILRQTQQQTSDAEEQQRVLEWLVTVFVHKFPKLSREEIKTMLALRQN
jgi:predicted transposase YdaD